MDPVVNSCEACGEKAVAQLYSGRLLCERHATEWSDDNKALRAEVQALTAKVRIMSSALEEFEELALAPSVIDLVVRQIVAKRCMEVRQALNRKESRDDLELSDR